MMEKWNGEAMVLQLHSPVHPISISPSHLITPTLCELTLTPQLPPAAEASGGGLSVGARRTSNSFHLRSASFGGQAINQFTNHCCPGKTVE